MLTVRAKNSDYDKTSAGFSFTFGPNSKIEMVQASAGSQNSPKPSVDKFEEIEDGAVVGKHVFHLLLVNFPLICNRFL